MRKESKTIVPELLRITRLLMSAVFAMSVLAGCHGLKMGVGLRGEMIDDNMMTLDGDTFVIHGQLGENMLIVYDYKHPDDDRPYYLLKQECNGFYYPQISANDMSSIDNTAEYICIDDRDVYDINHKKMLFKSSCDVLNFSYIGKWKNRLLFAGLDTICFSDGRCVGLKDGVYYETPSGDSMLILVDGARKIKVSFADLYNATSKTNTDKKKDSTVEKLARDYYIKARGDYDNTDAGFKVDMDVPKGNSKADNAMRQWMMEALTADVFSLLEYTNDISAPNCETLDELKSSLDRYGTLWEKLCRAEYQVGDTLAVRLTCDIKVSKVADCGDYVTYRYCAILYEGGLHELPHSYYRTYDKRRNVWLNINNSLKQNQIQAFRKMVLNGLKSEYDLQNDRKSSWEDFTNSIFSFHCSSIDTVGIGNDVHSVIEHYYRCDDWAGWDGFYERAFTERNFPLTHFAVLPEGIVLTYHPYQIDSFAAGEYHVVVPFGIVEKCLLYPYRENTDGLPKLEDFIYRPNS